MVLYCQSSDTDLNRMAIIKQENSNESIHRLGNTNCYLIGLAFCWTVERFFFLIYNVKCNTETWIDRTWFESSTKYKSPQVARYELRLISVYITHINYVYTTHIDKVVNNDDGLMTYYNGLRTSYTSLACYKNVCTTYMLYNDGLKPWV